MGMVGSGEKIYVLGGYTDEGERTCSCEGGGEQRPAGPRECYHWALCALSNLQLRCRYLLQQPESGTVGALCCEAVGGGRMCAEREGRGREEQEPDSTSATCTSSTRRQLPGRTCARGAPPWSPGSRWA